MSLSKLFQVYEPDDDKVWKTCKTEKECVKFLRSNDLSDYMGDLTLSIRPVWTNNPDKLLED